MKDASKTPHNPRTLQEELEELVYLANTKGYTKAAEFINQLLPQHELDKCPKCGGKLRYNEVGEAPCKKNCEIFFSDRPKYIKSLAIKVLQDVASAIGDWSEKEILALIDGNVTYLKEKL